MKSERYTVTPEFVDAAFSAMIDRDPVRLANILHDDVIWTISGPVEALPFCGRHVGKAATMDVILRIVPQTLTTRDFILDMKLIDGDCAAFLSRLHGTNANGRSISYRICHFLRFVDGKIIELNALLDSFDAAEQVIGQHIALPKHDAPATAEDVVAI